MEAVICASGSFVFPEENLRTGFHNTRLVGPSVRPPRDLSHPSASHCTYCSHSRSNEARLNELGSNWVMTSVGAGGLGVGSGGGNRGQ